MTEVTFADWVQLGSAVGVAAAAAASWASVVQSRALIRENALPELHAELARIPVNGMIGIEVHNAGGGLAKSAGAIVMTKDHFAVVPVATFLRSGESSHHAVPVGEPFNDQRLAIGVLYCGDARDRLYAWSITTGEKKNLGRHRAPLQPDALWELFYPDQPLVAREPVEALRSGSVLP